MVIARRSSVPYLLVPAAYWTFLPLRTTEVDQFLSHRILRLVRESVVRTGQLAAKNGFLSTVAANCTTTLFVDLGLTLRADQ